uniref:Uncharacterized protein n=1 Tax=Arion vulgaris TaxID=1028688 RepID=A0A0B7ANZ5_9EUPU
MGRTDHRRYSIKCQVCHRSFLSNIHIKGEKERDSERNSRSMLTYKRTSKMRYVS